ncbi:MAG: transcription antitermination factor NusB [Acutalibacteraceae bacterium]|nr:transcription antitermination factor NusB [Acutalibacteraceae bacterium]
MNFESWCIMTRKQAREEAFILIFEKELNDSSLDEILDLAEQVREIKPDQYVKNVFFGVFENLEKIDGIISKNAVGWSINRITKTSLAVLRLAIYEIEFVEDIPVSVSINEAVELTKKYSTKEDSSFVNGILSTVAKAKENAQ